MTQLALLATKHKNREKTFKNLLDRQKVSRGAAPEFF